MCHTDTYINTYDMIFVSMFYFMALQISSLFKIDLCLTFTYDMHYIISGENNFTIFLTECRYVGI